MTSTALLYGPLTTVYTPPATCLTNAYGNFYQSGVLPDVTLGSEDISGMIHDECLPPNFNPNRVMVPVGWYSPGVCPSGWKVAKVGTAPDTGLQSEYTSASFSTSSVPDETTVWCCPRCKLRL
ncbi:hypothetical protein NEMBOFW57_004475 [Staphylotrichum longicolle]|uniref:Uncharacterized protein n=1 Tax=Staphylotrichum longicolle TaxID=669026 RepID=A0AAD4F769_9PEZI|nr:hypothetical protein NEMBOFW57_004475 [Staphylotrichum longicolle]